MNPSVFRKAKLTLVRARSLHRSYQQYWEDAVVSSGYDSSCGLDLRMVSQYACEFDITIHACDHSNWCTSWTSGCRDNHYG